MVPGTKVPHFPLLLWGLVFHCLRGFCLFGTVCGWWLCLRTVLLWVAPSLPQLSPIISKNQPHHCFVVFLVGSN